MGFTDCPSKPIRNWVSQAAKETTNNMGSLDLLIQANTRMHFTTKYHCWVWTKTTWEAKRKMEIRENNPFDSKLYFRDVYGFTWENTTSTNPQFVDLSSQPLNITKNGVLAWRTMRKT